MSAVKSCYLTKIPHLLHYPAVYPVLARDLSFWSHRVSPKVVFFGIFAISAILKKS